MTDFTNATKIDLDGGHEAFVSVVGVGILLLSEETRLKADYADALDCLALMGFEPDEDGNDSRPFTMGYDLAGREALTLVATEQDAAGPALGIDDDDLVDMQHEALGELARAAGVFITY